MKQDDKEKEDNEQEEDDQGEDEENEGTDGEEEKVDGEHWTTARINIMLMSLQTLASHSQFLSASLVTSLFSCLLSYLLSCLRDRHQLR